MTGYALANIRDDMNPYGDLYEADVVDARGHILFSVTADSQKGLARRAKWELQRRAKMAHLATKRIPL